MISCTCFPLQQTSCWGSLIRQPIEQDLVRSSRRWSGEASQDARERSEGAASLNATRMSSRKIAVPSHAARSPRVSTATSPGPRIPTGARTARIPEDESFAPTPERARAPCSGARCTPHCAESWGERGLVLGAELLRAVRPAPQLRPRSFSMGDVPQRLAALRKEDPLVSGRRTPGPTRNAMVHRRTRPTRGTRPRGAGSGYSGMRSTGALHGLRGEGQQGVASGPHNAVAALGDLVPGTGQIAQRLGHDEAGLVGHLLQECHVGVKCS